MVHGNALCIITWQPTSRVFPPSVTWGHAEQLCWLDRWEPLTVSNENTMAYEFEFGIFVLIVIFRDCSGKSALISRRKDQISDKYDELTVSTHSLEWVYENPHTWDWYHGRKMNLLKVLNELIQKSISTELKWNFAYINSYLSIKHF